MRHRPSLAVWLCLPLLAWEVAAQSPPAVQPLTPQNRLGIVRALAFEYATTRQPLPASQKEQEALVLASTGQVNEAKLRQDLANRGAAIYTGEIVQITAIEFRRDSILFAINGGGKKNKKWYQRIQIQGGGPVGGSGPQPLPGPPQPEPVRSGIGSWILLTFPDYLPDVAPEQVKQMLARVLDFSQRSAVVPWIETIPEPFRQAIKDRKAVVGMNREMVLAARGRPDRKVREVENGRETEDWIYGNPPFVTFVTFVGDEVVEVKEFR